jgi:hypothetical protein
MVMLDLYNNNLHRSCQSIILQLQLDVHPLKVLRLACNIVPLMVVMTPKQVKIRQNIPLICKLIWKLLQNEFKVTVAIANSKSPRPASTPPTNNNNNKEARSGIEKPASRTSPRPASTPPTNNNNNKEARSGIEKPASRTSPRPASTPPTNKNNNKEARSGIEKPASRTSPRRASTPPATKTNNASSGN